MSTDEHFNSYMIHCLSFILFKQLVLTVVILKYHCCSGGQRLNYYELCNKISKLISTFRIVVCPLVTKAAQSLEAEVSFDNNLK